MLKCGRDGRNNVDIQYNSANQTNNNRNNKP